MSRWFAALLLLFASPAGAQTPRDTEAEVIETTYRLLDTGAGEITMHRRVRALSAQGRAAISRVQIPFAAAFDEVEIQSIRTVKKDGSVVEGNPSSAFEGGVAGNSLLPMFTDTRLKTVLPPNLDTGDAVDYVAVLRIKKWPKDGDFWFSHTLIQAGEVKSETVVLDLPAARKVTLYENPETPGRVETANGRRIERWTASHSAAANPSADGQQPLFAVTSISSWKEFGDWIRSLNAKAAEPTPEIAQLAAKLTAGKTTAAERIAALDAFVATKIRYVAVAFGMGRLQPHTAAEVLHNGYGDCKDQTALLSALLTAAGMKPHAVLTTPGAGVRVRETPMPTQFTHEFTAVDTASGLVFLDPSLGPAPPQALGAGIRGRSAVLVGDTTSVIDIPSQSPVPSKSEFALKGKIAADGSFDGSLRLEVQGVEGAAVRRVFLDAVDADKEKFLRQIVGPELKTATIRQITASDPADLSKPLTVECAISSRQFFPPAQDTMRITFQVVPPLAQALALVGRPQHPFPVEASSNRRTMDLTVDTSFTISDHPGTHRKASFGAFDSEYSYNKGHLFLNRTFEMNGAPIAPADWDRYVEFVRAAQTEAAEGFLLSRHGGAATRTGASPLERLFQDGGAALQRGDFTAARETFLEAVRMNPRSAPAWLGLAASHHGLRDFKKAEEAYKRAIELNPKDRFAYTGLATVYAATGRSDEAIAAFRKQLEVAPGDARAEDGLAFAYGLKHRWTEARALDEAATKATPENAARWARLGQAEAKLGQTEEAARSFDRALSLPHDPMVENNVAYYMADAGVQLDKAWKLISGALEPETRSVCRPEKLANDAACAARMRRVGRMLDTAGWVLYRQGKPAEAEPYVAAACAISPEPELLLHRAILAAKNGHADDALRAYLEARSWPSFPTLDDADARRDLAKALGGEAQLDTRLKQAAPPPTTDARVLALVDEKGQALETASADGHSPAPVDAKALKLPPIAWPGHALRSVRTVELSRSGDGWTVVRSYIGPAPQ